MNIATNPSSTNINKTGGWRTFIPITDLNKCISCGACARACPENAITMIEIDGKLKPKTNLDFCKGCGLCAAECPVKCIVMELDKK